jgi:hypothetical protein
MNTVLKRLGVVALITGSMGCALAATIHVTLSGRQEVPAVKSAARGEGTVTVLADHSLRAEVTVHGVKPTMVHIHEGATGANGPPVIWLKHAGGDVWRVAPGTKLTPSEYKAFRAGELYFNVHSQRDPAGELRGQIKP